MFTYVTVHEKFNEMKINVNRFIFNQIFYFLSWSLGLVRQLTFGS